MKGPEKIVLLLALCLCASCGVHRYVPSETVIVRDSTVVHIKDSVAIRYDTVSVELPKESSSVLLASSDSSHLETSLATSDAWIDTVGRLHHNLENKAGTLKKEVAVPEHYHSETTEAEHQQKETIIETVEVEKQLSWWQKLWITSGKILWGLISATVLCLLAKLAFKLF